MNILLWVLQALLAAAFLAHGLPFAHKEPPAEISPPQMNRSAAAFVLGVSGWREVAALSASRCRRDDVSSPGSCQPLQPASCFVMVSATIWHVVRGEISSADRTRWCCIVIGDVTLTYMPGGCYPIRSNQRSVSV
jgi:hypothetical protein